MKLITYDDLGAIVLMALDWGPLSGWRSAAARCIGDLDRLTRGGRRRAVDAALSRFNPAWSDAEVAEMSRRVYRDRWGGQGDALYRAWADAAGEGEFPAAEVPRVEGWNRLRAALERGRGVILWESPFGSRTRLHITLLHEGIAFVQVHGAEHGGSGSWIGQKLLRDLRRRPEERVVPEILNIQEGAYSYLRTIKARLADNRVVCMPGLGPKGRRFVRLDFLGRQESFATGVASLALSTGAALLPVYCLREASGEWTTIFEEPVALGGFKDRDEAQAAAVEQYARLLESYIRRRPEQWRRWHAAPIAAGRKELPAVLVDRTGGTE